LFEAINQNMLSYHWDFGVTSSQTDTSTLANPIFMYTTTGNSTIRLIVGNGCEFDTLSRNIDIIKCEPAAIVDPTQINELPFWLPSAFSPNGDGLNEVLKPILNNHSQSCFFIQMEIYNRWANKVFASENVMQGSDGKSRNQDLPMGTYVCVISYRIQYRKYVTQSQVTLIR
jgi:gliding motility-associated-like protein